MSTSSAKEEGDIPSEGVIPHPVINNLKMSSAGTAKLLKGLNTPDKISIKVLNKLAEEIAQPNPCYYKNV